MVFGGDVALEYGVVHPAELTSHELEYWSASFQSDGGESDEFIKHLSLCGTLNTYLRWRIIVVTVIEPLPFQAWGISRIFMYDTHVSVAIIMRVLLAPDVSIRRKAIKHKYYSIRLDGWRNSA